MKKKDYKVVQRGRGERNAAVNQTAHRGGQWGTRVRRESSASEDSKGGRENTGSHVEIVASPFPGRGYFAWDDGAAHRPQLASARPSSVSLAGRRSLNPAEQSGSQRLPSVLLHVVLRALTLV